MNRDKQIDEMARTMCFQRESCTVKSCTKVNCEKTWLAENLYNAGYRKSTDLAREIFEEIEDVLNNIGYFDEIDFKALKKKYTEGEG